MSIARPAAEIEPFLWMFSSNWILPGPIRPSGSRSIRTLREGSDLTPGFGMQYFLTKSFSSEAASLRGKQKLLESFTGRLNRLHTRMNTGNSGVALRDELSIVGFAAQSRSRSAQTSPCIGAIDPHSSFQP